MRTLISILALLALPATACELLVEARVRDVSTDEGRAGRAQQGMVVVAKDDGWNWGTHERLPRYVLIKIPKVSHGKVGKYLLGQYQDGVLYRYRVWRVRWEDLPLAARNKLRDTGELVIKATDAYTGDYDYTWAQVKGFFRNLETGLDETGDL